MKNEIREGRLLTRVRLEGKRFRVFEDALIDTGAAFTVVHPVVADFLELEVNREFPKRDIEVLLTLYVSVLIPV